MTKFDLNELRRLLVDATPAPWNDPLSGFSVTSGDGAIICDMRCADITTDKMVANQELIVAMRNALPALLAEAEAGAELARVVAPLVADRDVGADAMRVLLRGGLREYDAAVGVE